MLDGTPWLRLYARYRQRSLRDRDYAGQQTRQLLGLARRAANTRFGREHGFSTIRSVSDFQARVPLRRYDEFWQEYWKPVFPTLVDCTWPGLIPFFALSSGTSTGTTKFIPCSREMVSSNAKAALDLAVHHVTNRPRSRPMGGKIFLLGGSTDLVRRAPGVRSGDLSGIVAVTCPWWARSRYFPGPDLALIKDWEEKVATLARRSLQEDIRVLAGVPSWLLILFDRLCALRPGAEHGILAFYPHLELMIHGGVNFAPYRQRFLEITGQGRVDLRENYPASEGYIASADRGYGEGLRVVLDHGIFFEFVPLEELGGPNPTRHWIGNVRKDVNYAIVLSTCAGLWSYVLGDTVRFTDLDPPRLLVTGRTSYSLSCFGEHLRAEEIEDAVAEAARMIGRSVVDYSVGALFPDKPGELGGHLYVVEYAPAIPTPEEIRTFAEVLDRQLRERNEDYEGHRAGGFGLNPPRVVAMPPGAFAAWMRQRGKLGGQNKVPRIVTDPDLFRSLREFSGVPCLRPWIR